MKKMLVLAAVLPLAFTAMVAAAVQPRIPQTLKGHAVVLDPGHGGLDPGANKDFRGEMVAEAPYVFDVAKRVEALILKRGGRPFMTVLDAGIAPRDWHAQKILPLNRTATFAFDYEVVRAGKSGLAKRVIFANQIFAKYATSGWKVSFAAIHFDSLKRQELAGVRIILPDRENRLGENLRLAFDARKRLRSEFPVVKIGDHGVRNLFVLRHVKAANRVLIELGNFSNEADLWRIRDWKVRQAYAETITEAFERLAKESGRKTTRR